MKRGGGKKISSFEAIIGLLIIAAICLIISLQVAFKPLGCILVTIIGTCVAASVVIWQIDLNSTLKKLRSDSKTSKNIWNIFQFDYEYSNCLRCKVFEQEKQYLPEAQREIPQPIRGRTECENCCDGHMWPVDATEEEK